MTTQLEAPATTSAPETTVPSCPDCGATLEPAQRYCVECGAAVGEDYRPHPSWRLPAAIVAVVVLLVGAGAAFALTEIASDSNADSAQPAPTQAASPPVQPGQPADALPPAEQPPAEATPTAPAGTGAAQTDGQGTPAPGGEQDGAPAEWPAGKAAYTVILFSTDARPGAEAKAREAMSQGIPAGVLRSDDYPTLRAGYWVVFAGQFESREQAEKEAESYAGLGFPDGYPRFVNP